MDLANRVDRARQWESVIASVESTPLEPGNWWFLISAGWLRSWQSYCQDLTGAAPPPGGITTDNLIHPLSSKLGFAQTRDGLVVDEDYVVVPEEAWNLLTSWYGLSEGSLAISRPVAVNGESAFIDVNLPSVKFRIGNGTMRRLCFPRGYTVGQLKRIFITKEEAEKREERLMFGEENNEICVTSFTGEEDISVTSFTGDEDISGAPFNSKDKIEQSPLFTVYYNEGRKSLDNDAVLVSDTHLLNSDAYLVVDAAPEMLQCDAEDVKQSLIKLNDTSGLSGLRNLGNTCFMNSALQCLSNCEPLTSFFLHGHHVSQINRSNPIGTGGALAEAYGALVKDIWQGNGCCGNVADPSRFKHILGRFEHRFMGYHQQDSQELLSALLDRLHEDVNRIVHKPYIELQDSDGRPDCEIAKESWTNHKLRNDSVVVDNFHGQFRSSVVCPNCGYNSVTFDPFLFVSLPLPNASLSTLEVTFVRHDHAIQMRIPVDRVHAKIDNLLDSIGEATGISVSQLVPVEIYDHSPYKVYRKDYPLSRINQPSDDIKVYVAESDFPVWITFKLEAGGGYTLPVAFPLLLSMEKDEEIVPAIRSLVAGIIKTALPNIDLSTIDWDKLARIDEDRSLGIDCLYSGYIVVFSRTYCRDELGVDLGTVFENLEPEVGPPVSQPKAVSLQDCLDLFTMEERLSADELWYCKRCKDHQQASKKMDLWRLPNVLVIHLKRFSYSRLWGEKVSTRVDYPINGLDLRSNLPSGEHPVYDLFAVSNHHGGLGGGHYTALAKNFVNGQWFNFDDSYVSKVDASTLQSKDTQRSAYLLFYIRRDDTNNR
ncbi:hypothetical protein PSACC_01589 [Paramicrosporidium saccamoebae]|uniref:Ubiquitin carboxyl-terminal hydrolase n=1 Tax=Paramicrosporidium saccamoebae TaxID=1246581 RepID=A0A2H9TLG2_9FUNG|nr:hypothetical protein PSACC_01589 [Paramicrosporidium saccamoebae]